jgi:hypothetical protein
MMRYARCAPEGPSPLESRPVGDAQWHESLGITSLADL